MALYLVVLFTFLSGSLFAAESFGGIRFHSSVLPEHKEFLKADLKFLYRLPVQKVSQDLFQITELSFITGPSLHYWLVERVKHIVGEGFQATNQTVKTSPYANFPATPLPLLRIKPVARAGAAPYVQALSVTIMSNMSATYYNFSKETKILRTFHLDGMAVPFTSTRAGVIKVGEGLFHKIRLINANPVAQVNMITRLMTLFHEARHSDGTGEHAGFYHDYCPPNHSYALNLACDKSGNGPYSVGAIVMKQLLKTCTTCTAAEKSKLEAKVADSLNRVLKVSDVAKVNQISTQIKRLQYIVTLYKTKKNAYYASEVTKLEKQITSLRTSLAKAQNSMTPPPANPRPEGVWKPRYLQDTQALMEKSLQK